MSTKKIDLKGDELFYGHMAEYLDGELPVGLQAQFNALLTSKQKELEAFQVNRGKFQAALGDVGGSEALKHKLRSIVQDDQLRATMEASEIADVERSEFWSNLLRRSVLIGIILGLIGFGVYYFMPERLGSFDVIEYIGYEALALEEDPEGRINLPSTDLEEIRQFVAAIPGLDFKPELLRPLSGWVPQGVSIIDYDVMKVVAISYTSPDRGNEHLHHFMFPGTMANMKYRGEEADYRGIKYRVYASDRMNIVVWQQTQGMVAVLAGHRSAPELAEMARAGTPE